jgi:predicted HicB family RNase H-like nuclease
VTKSRSVLSYGEFQGSADISVEDNCLFGRILHIDDVVTYEADSPQELEEAFKTAVDDYLAFCKEEGHNPCKPYKGVFNVRVSPDLHKKIAFLAKKRGMSLNEMVNEALSEKINTESKTAGPVIHNHKYFITLNEQEAYDLEETPQWLEKLQKPKLSLVQ